MSESQTYSISYGEIAFNAYREAANQTAYDGTPIPAWPDLSARIRDCWELAALAVLRRAHQRDHGGRDTRQVEHPD